MTNDELLKLRPGDFITYHNDYGLFYGFCHIGTVCVGVMVLTFDRIGEDIHARIRNLRPKDYYGLEAPGELDSKDSIMPDFYLTRTCIKVIHRAIKRSKRK